MARKRERTRNAQTRRPLGRAQDAAAEADRTAAAFEANRAAVEAAPSDPLDPLDPLDTLDPVDPPEEAPDPFAAFSDSFDIPEGEQLTREERIERVERSQARRRHKKLVRRLIWALVALVAAAIVAACVAFALLRWETYDDTADFVGQWRIVGTDKVIEVTEDTIVLTDDVAYRYTVDAQAKTITFKFGNMVGSARYRFSLDRQLLSITDGEFDWWTTLCDDVPWTIAALFTQWIGDGAQLSPGSGTFVTELTRNLDPSSDPTTDDAADANDADDASSTEPADDAGDAAADGDADGADSDAADQTPEDGTGTDATATDQDGSSSSTGGTRDVDALDISDIGAGA